MPIIPTLPLLCSTFFVSHAMVSYASLLSSTSLGVFLSATNGRAWTNSPCDFIRPRTSWKAKMYPAFQNSGEGESRAGGWSTP